MLLASHRRSFSEPTAGDDTLCFVGASGAEIRLSGEGDFEDAFAGKPGSYSVLKGGVFDISV